MASLHVARAESLWALRHVSVRDTQSACFSCSETNEDTKNAECLLFFFFLQSLHETQTPVLCLALEKVLKASLYSL